MNRLHNRIIVRTFKLLFAAALLAGLSGLSVSHAKSPTNTDLEVDASMALSARPVSYRALSDRSSSALGSPFSNRRSRGFIDDALEGAGFGYSGANAGETGRSTGSGSAPLPTAPHPLGLANPNEPKLSPLRFELPILLCGAGRT
jgi:hypothetical protein